MRLFLLFFLINSSLAFATYNSCEYNEFKYLDINLDPIDQGSNRARIIQYAKMRELPFFIMKAPYGDVPVMLVNKKTIEYLSPIFSQTFGIAESLHPQNEANHGYARLPGKVYGDKGAVLMDLFSPPEAGWNAMHGNGYRWKSIQEYFAKRKPGSTQFIDLAYAANRKELETFYLLHAAKRAALYRIVYKFESDPYNAWNQAQRRMLFEEAGREHCNNSRLGGCAPSHAHQMRQRLIHLGIKDVNALFANEHVHRFLDTAKNQILEADWKNPEQLGPNMLRQDRYFEMLKTVLPERLSREEKVDLMSYLLSLNIVEEALTLQYHKGIVESRTEQYENSNINAILIYDEYTGTPQGFYTGNATFYGAPSGRGFGSPFPVAPAYENPTSINWRRWSHSN